MTSQPINLTLYLIDDGANEEQVDQLISNLMRELRDLELDSIERAQSGLAPTGARGDPFTIGALALAILPTVLPKLLEFLQTRLGENRKLVLEAPNGLKITFTPDHQYSGEEIIALARQMMELSSKNDRRSL